MTYTARSIACVRDWANCQQTRQDGGNLTTLRETAVQDAFDLTADVHLIDALPVHAGNWNTALCVFLSKRHSL